MPLLDAVQLPPPSNWQDFESLCRDLFAAEWDELYAAPHGRDGQGQQGVDIYGRACGNELHAVQCKLHDVGKGAGLTLKEVTDELDKVEGTGKTKGGKDREPFSPQPKLYVIATTAQRDAGVQKQIRELSSQREENGLFPIDVLFWDDLQKRLAGHLDVLDKHYPQLGLGTRHRALVRYLDSEWKRHLRLPFLGISERGTSRSSLRVHEVYTELATTDWTSGNVQFGLALIDETHSPPAGVDSGVHQALVEWVSQHDPDTRHAISALWMADACSRLVLLGRQGSGKTTFARHLALCLTGEQLGRAEADLQRVRRGAGPAGNWRHANCLPIFVRLADFVAADAFPGLGRGETAHFCAHLRKHHGPTQILGEHLEYLLDDGGRRVLFLLDGLDETPANAEERRRLAEVIQSLSNDFPGARILVTSRPYAYENDRGFQETLRQCDQPFAHSVLAPLEPQQVQQFLEHHFAVMAARDLLPDDEAAERAARLASELGRVPDLVHLASSPLMLSMIADLYATDPSRDFTNRTSLYERSVDVLFDRWNETEKKSLTRELKIPKKDVVAALRKLAFQVHSKRGVAKDQSQGGAADIELGELFVALRERAADDLTVVQLDVVKDYLHERSGLLIAEGPELFRFPHRSYQEYLAACYLKEDLPGFPDGLIERVKEDPALWREVWTYAIEQSDPPTAWLALDELLPEKLDDEPELQRTILAVIVLRSPRLLEVRHHRRNLPTCEALAGWFARCLELGGLATADRAEVGQVLGQIGDPRQGVRAREGRPEFDWITIPAGPFTMGSDDHYRDEQPQHEERVDEFRIARYPVTVEQFAAFVDADSYAERGYWSDAGWEWSRKHNPDGRSPVGWGGDEVPARFWVANHPRINVCWHEAVAFCRWASEVLEQEVRLPTEAEWENAARGDDARFWAWGNEEREDHANWRGEQGGTTAVGLFPKGKSPHGLLDATGQVWEWCSTRWRASLAEEADETSAESTTSRVLRGGSWANTAGYCRCSARRERGPGNRGRHVGFRVAAAI